MWLLGRKYNKVCYSNTSIDSYWNKLCIYYVIIVLPANCDTSPNINLCVLWKIYIHVYTVVLFVWYRTNWKSLNWGLPPPFHGYFTISHWGKVILLKFSWFKRYKLYKLNYINYRTNYQEEFSKMGLTFKNH